MRNSISIDDRLPSDNATHRCWRTRIAKGMSLSTRTVIQPAPTNARSARSKVVELGLNSAKSRCTMAMRSPVLLLPG